MLIEKNIQRLFSQLANQGFVVVPFQGSDILMRLIDKTSKLSLTTLVYEGRNYIPRSVRECLSRRSSTFQPGILTFLTVDESQFEVRLNYLGRTESVGVEDLQSLLEEFSAIAEKWRLYLDDHDKHDLVHVRVK